MIHDIFANILINVLLSIRKEQRLAAYCARRNKMFIEISNLGFRRDRFLIYDARDKHTVTQNNKQIKEG